MKITTRNVCLFAQVVVIAFLITGMLTDFGILEQYDPRQIYTFAYVGYGLSAFLFFETLAIRDELKDKTA